MREPAVSVVVPVYNVERYLRRCLDSLAAQTLEGIEVILVNDGSSDGSGEILREYARRVPAFRLCEQMNRGYSGARNAGLALATGKFVGFVDADDWVEPEMFQHLFELAESRKADIAQCSFAWYLEQEDRHEARDNSWIPPLLAQSGGALRGAEAILLEDIAIWKKIYRRTLLEGEGLAFDEKMPMGEDVPFHLSALCLARKIAASDRPLYHYRRQRSGQQTSISDARLLAFFDIFTNMRALIDRKRLPELAPWMLHLQLSRHCYGYELARPELHDVYFDRLRRTFSELGIRAGDPIAAGPLRHGSLSTRFRWLSLRFLHPRALKAIVSGDREGFDRLIRCRVWLQNAPARLLGFSR